MSGALYLEGVMTSFLYLGAQVLNAALIRELQLVLPLDQQN